VKSAEASPHPPHTSLLPFTPLSFFLVAALLLVFAPSA
jgi:predicted membrane metal-binding protein